MLPRAFKGLLQLADDFKIPEDLAVQAGAHPKEVADGLLVLEDVTHAVKVGGGPIAMGTQQADQVLRGSGKTVKFGAVASAGYQQPVDAFLPRLLQQGSCCIGAQRKQAARYGVGFFKIQSYRDKPVMSRNMIFLHTHPEMPTKITGFFR